MDADEYLDGPSVNFWMSQAKWKNCQNAKGYPQLGFPNP